MALFISISFANARAVVACLPALVPDEVWAYSHLADVWQLLKQ